MGNDRPKYRHRGFVRDGKLRLASLSTYQEHLNSLEGKKVFYTLQEEHEQVTMDQYAYFYGVVVKTALDNEQFGGWSKRDFTKYMEYKLLREEIQKDIEGETVSFVVQKEAKSMNVKDFSDFIERVKDILLFEHKIKIKEKEDYE